MTDSRIVKEYEPLVIKLATHIRRSFGLSCELDDLIGFGFTGLLEAQQRYDASRGVQFSTFAYYRVRGAILDGVRQMAYLPRRFHAKLKAAEAALRVGEELGETLAQGEEAGQAQLPAEATEALEHTLASMTAAFVLSSLGQSDDDQPKTPEAILSSEARADELRSAVEELPDRERALVEGFYFSDRRFDEVAAELGISKSWASRLHGKALERLRAALEPD